MIDKLEQRNLLSLPPIRITLRRRQQPFFRKGLLFLNKSTLLVLSRNSHQAFGMVL